MKSSQEITNSIVLKKGREHSFTKHHHWIFSGAVEKVEGSPVEGELVWIKNFKGKSLGYGFYGTQSIINRVLAFDTNLKPNDKILDLLKKARKKRKALGLLQSESTNAFRFFHSEGDLLPGLTIDKFDKIFVIQSHHQGIINQLDIIKEYLLRKFPDTESIILKKGRSTESKDNFIFLHGTNSQTTIKENNISFLVNVLEGQKTGFFLDQRENRELLGRLSENKSVLNLYCFSGGFSLYALKNNAKKVISVDSSESAIQAAKENISLNGLSNESFDLVCAKCEDYLSEAKYNFDIIVCDPPALVKKRTDLKKGLKHYKQINLAALKHLNNNGLFFSYSCSQFVSSKNLLNVLKEASQELGLKIEVVKELKQAPCHTINPKHEESIYLKGFLVKVS